MPALRFPSLPTVLGAASVLFLAACGGGDQPTGPSALVNPPSVPTAGANTSFDIRIRFVGDGATPRLREAFSRAAARWSEVIVGDAGTTVLNATAGECRSWMPALNESVNDLVVYVRAAPIDGINRVVAQASPCYVNSETKLPILGSLELDSDDIDDLVNRNVLDDVVLHELGHVLGIGTLWNYKRSLLVGAGTDDPHFTGSSTHNAFLAVGGTRYDGTPVPVENSGTRGTRDSHWRASIFGAELMQGFAQAGGMPLSTVTIASLADLGYRVSMAAADPFSLFAALRIGGNSAPAGGITALGDDVVRSPLYEVDPQGRRRPVRPL